MKSYKVRAMVEIEALVQFNHDSRFEGPFDAARAAMARIEECLKGNAYDPSLTGQVGSISVTPLGTDGGSSYG